MYQDAETVVLINGVLSWPYTIDRGVCQGDPLSCLIFNLAIESLAQLLRDSELEEFKTDNETERLITTLFADDTTMYLSDNDNFHDLGNILDKWCRLSGAKFNIKKTVILPVGTPEYQKSVIDT